MAQMDSKQLEPHERECLVAELSYRLRQYGFDDKVRDAIAAACVEELATYVPDEGEATPASEGPFRHSYDSGVRLDSVYPSINWVVRNDDLNFYGVLFQALSALAASDWLLGNMTSAALISFFSAMFLTYKRVREKGARLRIDETQLVVALKRDGASSAGELAMSLDWKVSTVEEVLNSLCAVRQHDGGVIAVVSKDGEGKWGCNGV